MNTTFIYKAPESYLASYHTFVSEERSNLHCVFGELGPGCAVENVTLILVLEVYRNSISAPVMDKGNHACVLCATGHGHCCSLDLV